VCNIIIINENINDINVMCNNEMILMIMIMIMILLLILMIMKIMIIILMCKY